MSQNIFLKKTKISEEFKSEVKEHFNDVSALITQFNVLFNNILTGAFERSKNKKEKKIVAGYTLKSP